jgi:hypothetical protein
MKKAPYHSSTNHQHVLLDPPKTISESQSHNTEESYSLLFHYRPYVSFIHSETQTIQFPRPMVIDKSLILASEGRPSIIHLDISPDITRSSQNSCRKAVFQCTITFGTFVPLKMAMVTNPTDSPFQTPSHTL